MYTDRIISPKYDDRVLRCPICERELGVKIVYAKENRLAYRLFQSSVSKKIVKKAAAKRCQLLSERLISL